MLKTKVFYNDPDYVHKQQVVEGYTCTECNRLPCTDSKTVELCAELNAGEMFILHICKSCLKDLLTLLKEAERE